MSRSPVEDGGPTRLPAPRPTDTVGDDRGEVPRPRVELQVVAGGHEAELDGVDLVEHEWRRERPDIDVSSFGIVTRIWRIGRHLDAKRKHLLTGLATDRGSVDVLAMLRRSGKPYRQSAGQLTSSALITSGGVSQRLDKLERAGLVTRSVDTEDRRRVDVQLTAAGVELVDTVLAELTASDHRIIAEAMEPHEQEMLRSLLRKLLTSLEPAPERVDGGH